jgi:nucleoside-diphosphate-sugar epimerase
VAGFSIVTRVLVTGARGFVGRHAIDALAARGHDVVAVTRRAPEGEQRPGVRWVESDLLQPNSARSLVAVARATHLLHLAWCAEHGAFWTSRENLDWIGASLRLLRAFAEADGRRAVVAGTCAEYAWGLEGRCVEGVTPTVPATLYGAAKHGLGVIAQAYAQQEGVSLAWGRVFFCFGPGEAAGRLVPSVARALLRGQEAAVTRGDQIRDYLAVDELAAAFAALLDSSVEGAVNLASGEPIALHDLVAMVGEAAGRPDLIRYGALAARPGEPAEIVASVDRLQNEVGWRADEPLSDSVARTVRWWREAEGLS